MRKQRWNKQRCMADAKKYKTRGEWAKSNGSAYQAARRDGLLDECCEHMRTSVKYRGIDHVCGSTEVPLADSDMVTIKVSPDPEALIGSPFHTKHK